MKVIIPKPHPPKMRFTYQALAVFISSLLVNSAAAHACESSAVWPDPADCHHFYQCNPGTEPAHKVCGAGTAFNPKISACDYEQNVPSCFKDPHHPRPFHA
ncbi:hypothetical protein AnigIFM56816_006894 [Aspergillus niger]|uniref:Chitin-binding type-2 domain-containing protein n=4 Tax=Aspergillus TaxID=5052 RepID=A0A3F3PW78_9EURO|nr:hypothetical protein BDQ94DRAFT_172306 [Aspergillus welwitschiae]RDK37137.1 hypothetical protein M752DRAFT_298540 [Aspergillus phoenicis ATCC 13157]GKZ54619.1 hypothetical protein AnigIFM49718_010434 [Aspergillus niger]RDH31201.1 hypothetical protein BDQ94DRAFT_172306 [Aspergillus welwitschiae]GKZ76626.1 hypothetical protein AnigIFM56816_006894 [Aspergillus niger]GLA41366.1 hypothetical protein AnigIFM63309_009455 [Aspergillus niger]